MKKSNFRFKAFVSERKLLSTFILIVFLLGSYWVYGKFSSTSGQTSYMVTTLKKGDVVSTITGTGQVSASSQVDIKSKVSGDLVYLNTKANGTQITKGTLIAQINTRDAQISLENAKIAYAKLVKPADESSMIQAQSGYDSAVYSNQKAYEDGFNVISTTFSELPAVINGLNDLIYSQSGYLSIENMRSVSQTALDYQSKAGVSLDTAKNNYDRLLSQYKTLSRTSSTSTVDSFITSTYDLVKNVSEAVKNTQNTIDYVRKMKNDTKGDVPASNVASWTSTINSTLASLLSAESSLSNSVQTIAQKKADLAKVVNGPDDLDLASQKLSLQQAENSYADYFIRAPFDGLLARLSVRPTDSVSSGSVIGTIVSSQKITTITLNEVDVSKVKVGQKAKLSFDAIDGLVMDGTVDTVDLVGTVTQGVVNYNVGITLDAQDDRIKSGMSVSASIITDTKQDVLVLPNSAVKSQGKFNYVEMFTTPLTVVKGPTGTPSTMKPVQKRVVIGSSNDSFTEIVSGINEGDQVITRTITSGTATTAKTTTPSLFGNTGGGGTRIPRN